MRRPRRGKHHERSLRLDLLRSEWAEEIRITAAHDLGIVAIAVRGELDDWARVEVGTGDIDDIIFMLVSARDEAQAALDQDLAARKLDSG